MEAVKVLVVDDEAIVLESCRKVLEDAGYEAHLVSNVEKALDAMRDEDFELLLIDVKMPGHDGLFLIKEIQKKWPGVPIVVMSGYHTRQTVEEAAHLGVATFIAKPFTPDELLKAVQRVLQKEEGHGKDEGPRYR